MKNLNKNITRKKQNNNFIVYIHIRPDINEPFYVGKGVPGREIRLCGRNQHWKNIVNKNKGKFEFEILFEGLNLEIFNKKNYVKDSPIVKQLDEIKEPFAYLCCGMWTQGELGQDRKDVGSVIKVFYDSFKNKKRNESGRSSL